jgi:hypothetical protein
MELEVSSFCAIYFFLQNVEGKVGKCVSRSLYNKENPQTIKLLMVCEETHRPLPRDN